MRRSKSLDKKTSALPSSDLRGEGLIITADTAIKQKKSVLPERELIDL